MGSLCIRAKSNDAIIVIQKSTIEALRESQDAMAGTIVAKNQSIASLTTIAETKEEVIVILMNKLEEAELEALKWHIMAQALVHRSDPLHLCVSSAA